MWDERAPPRPLFLFILCISPRVFYNLAHAVANAWSDLGNRFICSCGADCTVYLFFMGRV
jgi:hypothetical protein